MYFKASVTQSCGKRPGALPSRCFKSVSKVKRERGENASPRVDSRFAMSVYAAHFACLNSSRQNLAALGTAAGKNLAAVGSSHSLPETVNLGTMTTAGLVGTLH